MINEMNMGAKDELIQKPFLYLKWVTQAFRHEYMESIN